VKVKSRNKSAIALITLGALSLTTFVVAPAKAAQKGIGVDFTASYYLSYDHSVGGGAWDDGTINQDIDNSLEGSQFACEDTVSFLTKIKLDDIEELQGLGEMTLALDYQFDGNTTGQSGLAYTKFETVTVNRSPIVDLVTSEDTNDSALIETDPNSSAALSNVHEPDPAFTAGENLTGTITVDGLEAGETIIVRSDVKIQCKPGASPTGNILAKIMSARLVGINGGTGNTSVDVGIGANTVPMKRVANILHPSLQISKTGVEGTNSCSLSGDFTEISPGGTVTFCYVVRNDSNVTSAPGAPLYNLSSIADDNATPSDTSNDFIVDLTGLTDEDGDGQLDDLAAGATASASFFKQYNGEKDTYETNTATVFGYDAPTGGNKITASDDTVVYIDPPLPISLSIDKRTNGIDSSTIIVGTPITWTFDVTNTGGETLTNIVVNDDKLGVITCPASTLGIGASMQCAETGTAIEDWYYNVGTVTGKRLSDVDTATATDPSSYFGANPKISIVKSTDTPTVKESTSATFKILVTNIGNVALETVTVTDTQTAGCAKVIGALAVSETSTYTCFKETVTASFINTALVEGTFESTTVSDLDTATITVDYLPKIMVTKTANPTSVPETGGNVLFTYTVTNLGVETFTLTSLMDDKFGNLNGQGTCSVPKGIAVSGSESCTVTVWLSSGNLTPFTNVVTASGVDPEGNPATETATAGVTFTDVLPDITLLKTANPTVLMLPGGLVTYTFRITNSGSETVTVSSFSDSRFTLPSQCLSLIGETLTPGAYLSCTSSETVTSTTGLPIVNTATATAVDNEGNFDTATASATVNFSWYGRTPGYWKNHPESWPETYTAGLSVASIFFPTGDVPSFLSSSGTILNLNKIGGNDSLLDALRYKGGTDIKGAAQILLRAAVAALLNEKYYGAGYPGATSVADLIKQVHDVMIVNNRSAYLSLASTLDMWNNGNEGTI
jgi:uncharacterized repeat protein (TIGR01451 family)